MSDEIESFSQAEDSQFRDEVPGFLQVVAAEVALSQTFDPAGSSCAGPEDSQVSSDSDNPPLRKRRLEKAGLPLGSAFRRS